MKPILFIASGFALGVLATALPGWIGPEKETASSSVQKAKPQHPDSRRILAIRKVTLQPGVTPSQFEAFAQKVAAGDYGMWPGLKIYFGKAERGQEKGSYINFMEFDSKATRDFYAPEEDKSASRDVEKILQSFSEQYVKEAAKLAVIGAEGKYIDYIILQ